MTATRWTIGTAAVFVMMGAILAANWVTTDYGFIPVGLGFSATAGTIFAGLSLASRDLIQDVFGRKAVLLVIVAGTLISWAVSEPAIALASVSAYALAELLDFAVYTPLRARSRLGDRRWAVAVLASNVVGALVDTVVFLGVAFGVGAIGPALPGQMVGKAWATLAYLVIGAGVAWLIRRRRRARSA